jgi:hypothetical protein
VIIGFLLAMMVGVLGTFLVSNYFKLNWLIALPTSLLLFGLNIYFLSLIFGLKGFLFFLIGFLVIEVFLLMRMKSISDAFKNSIKNCTAPKVFLISGYFLPFWLFMKATAENWKIVNWDELSGWGPAIWSIFNNGRLWNNSDLYLWNKTYPPLQQIFQFSSLKIAGWDERLILISNNVTILVLILGFSGCIQKINQKTSLIAFYLGIVVYYWFGFNFKSILADGFLAVLFATSLTIALSLELNRSYIPVIVIYTASLSLVKPTGVFFGLLVGIIASMRLITAKQKLPPSGKSVNKLHSKVSYLRQKDQNLRDTSRNHKVHRYLGGAILIIAPLASWLTWQIYMITSHIPRLLIGHPNYGALFTDLGQIRLNKTLSAFNQGLLSPISELSLDQFGALVSPYFLVLIFTLANLLVSKQKFFLSKVGVPDAFIILTGWFFYQILMLFSYLFYFTEYEGTRVASFSRYQVGYIFAWFMYLIFKSLQKWTKASALSLLTILTIILGLISPGLKTDLRQIAPDPKLASVRNAMENQLNQINVLIKPDDKLYIITQNSTGYEKNLFYYLTLPNYSNNWCWSVGEPYYPEDVWTCPQKISQLIADYDFLYLNRADEQLFEALSEHIVFPINFKEYYFFKIVQSQDGISLTPLL